ncbi:DUF1534 domain-containing protein [Pseudomonas syringae]|uniref:DUF1534 domain-containing protein n=2 Tax=Pseudomonas syringae TaxID=317 RepID=A0A6B2BDA2_PSESX|nr:DUF1534 domain-containing protein [Pseudomonas syringae pv. atrofaciens]NAO34684.1 DUF1534 domain-containing protein [Pseudomonas syringae]NAO45268.1 DUF1534 domain-containing protein [Pseudomonas syringae]NAO50320.1 DUF1534 domain-containing protein [Pseudomonas syringae]NAO55625.1 DUF1534 domain-containing protein [Pseudomonas syringae]
MYSDERGAWARQCSPAWLSFLTLQRGNALGDALRHKPVARRILLIGSERPYLQTKKSPETTRSSGAFFWVFTGRQLRAGRRRGRFFPK